MIDSIDDEKCSGCNICFQICPCDVFRPIEGERLVRIVYREDCQTCFACEIDCPEGAIHADPLRKARVQPW